MVTSGDADLEVQSQGKKEVPDSLQLLPRLPEPTQRRMKPTDLSLCLPPDAPHPHWSLQVIPASS